MKSVDEEDKELRFFCPYCTQEVTIETTQCPKCGYAYGSDTLNMLTSSTKNPPSKNPCDCPRRSKTKKTFKIAYPTPKAFVNNYLSDVATGGLFIKTRAPLDPGEQFNLRIALPFIEEEAEVFCEVAWVRTEESTSPQVNQPLGMGLKFVNPTEAVAEKFYRILRDLIR